MEDTQSIKITDEWEVVAKGNKDIYDILEEGFRELGWAYVEDSYGIGMVIYVADIDEENKKIYVDYAFEPLGAKLVWDRNNCWSPCVEIAWYSPDMWDIEQTYLDCNERVWYGDDGKPYPIEEFIRDVAGNFAAEESSIVEKRAKEIAEEILRYEHGEDEDEEF